MVTAETTDTTRPEPSGPPDPSIVAPELRIAGGELAKLARKSPSATGRAVLARVAADAREGGRALIGVDLIRVYPPHLLVPDAPLPWQRAMGWLAVARDVLVFAPIALTWLSLGSALAKYDSGTNFLRLWADDYGSAAVVGVVVLIGLVIAITVALHALRLRAQRTGSRAQLRRSVGEQLTLITFELSATASTRAAAVPSGQLVRAAAEITVATSHLTRVLGEATDRLAQIFDPGPEAGFTKALLGWTASATALEEMGKSLTVPHQLVRDFAKMRESLSKDEAATRSSLGELLTELNEATETSRVSDQAHVRVAEVVLEGTRQVREAMERFVERTELLDMYMKAMTQTLDRLDQGWADAPPSTNSTATGGYYDPMADDGFAHLLDRDDEQASPSADPHPAAGHPSDEDPGPAPRTAPEPGPDVASPPPGDPGTNAPDAADTDDWYTGGSPR